MGDDIEIWDDQQIGAGKEWRAQIDKALGQTGIALLLVSPDFLASRFISEVELPILLADNRRVLCLHIRPSALTAEVPSAARQHLHVLAAFQSLNDPEKPLSLLPRPEQERLLAAVAAEISRQACEADELSPLEIEGGGAYTDLHGASLSRDHTDQSNKSREQAEIRRSVGASAYGRWMK